MNNVMDKKERGTYTSNFSYKEKKNISLTMRCRITLHIAIKQLVQDTSLKCPKVLRMYMTCALFTSYVAYDVH